MNINNHTNYSKNLGVSETIEFLKSLGLPALPVAPIQTDEKYWKRNKKTGEIKKDKEGNPELIFTGKNPSYLDNKGNPQIVWHSNYRDQLPDENKLKQWFSNPENGIGTLGGFHNIIFIDIDSDKFESQEDCKNQTIQWAERHSQVKNTWKETTHSGGYRVVVKVSQLPDFTNFSFESEGEHRGEALGTGRFTVLAPTIGPSGNPYKSSRKHPIVEVESLE